MTKAKQIVVRFPSKSNSFGSQIISNEKYMVLFRLIHIEPFNIWFIQNPRLPVALFSFFKYKDFKLTVFISTFTNMVLSLFSDLAPSRLSRSVCLRKGMGQPGYPGKVSPLTPCGIIGYLKISFDNLNKNVTVRFVRKIFNEFEPML